MMTRQGARALVAVVSAVGLWVACSGGLKLNEGNAFPCDFRQSEETRDLQCPQSWRCGIDGKCHDGQEEQAPLGAPPVFQSERRFPRRLDGDTRVIAGDPRFVTPRPPMDRPMPGFVASYDDGGTAFVGGPFSGAVSNVAQAQSVALMAGLMAVEARGASQLSLYSLDSESGSVSLPRTVPEPLGIPELRGLRVPAPSFDGGPRPALVVLRENGLAAEVDLAQATYKPLPAGFSFKPDGGVQPCSQPGPTECPAPSIPGDYKDVRLVSALSMVLPTPEQDISSLAYEPVPVVLTPSYFLWRSKPPEAAQPLGQWQVLNPGETLADGNMPQERWLMRHSMATSVWAVGRTVIVPRPGGGMNKQDVLSTWALLRTPTRPQEPRLERAWSDCSPCGPDRLVTFTPVSDGALGVEVLCESPASGARSLFRVTGASVVSPLETCLRRTLTAPFDLTELAREQVMGGTQTRPGAVDESRGAGILLGGAHGQIWWGDALSQLLPGFLDRAPVAVVPYQQQMLAFTRDFLSVGPIDRPDPRLPRGEGLFVQVPGRRPEEQTSEPLGNVVEGVNGWFLLESGQIFRVAFDTSAGVVPISAYGPRLLGPSGEPATSPYLGQGMPTNEGVSLVIAANDQLYYQELQLADVLGGRSEEETLSPLLTPEPNFPVRSLARDQTVSLTASQGPRVRGWVATSRSVFQFEQDAQTKAWSLTPLPLGDGQPVEVWTREAGGTGYGRLGLRDGQVLRLPQGLPITQPLPGTNPRVVDYASLNGWPVALGERAIYRTVPAPAAGGLLRWEPIELPSGLTDADLKDGRIAAVREQGVSVLYLFTRTGFVYQLARGAP